MILRIAIIAPFHNFGGSEHQILLLIRGLIKRGIEVAFFHLHIRSPELRKELEAIPQCEHVQIRLRSLKNPALLFWDTVKLARQMRERRCMVAHCWNYTGHIIGGIASCLGRLPCIFSIGGLDPWKRPWQMPFYRLLNTLPDCFVFQSSSERDIVCRKERIPQPLTRIIPNGMDRQRFFFSEAVRGIERGKICRELGIDPSLPLILSVGSLRPIKGHDLLIEAVKTVCSEKAGPGFHVLIVGDGPLRQGYEATARGFPITFCGFRKDVERFYCAADIYCQPSRSEGLPNAVIEAMSCGLPIIASDVGAMSELVVQNNGRLCQAEDMEGLADDLLWMLKHKNAWKAMGILSLKASDRFSADVMVDTYISLYRDAVSMRRSNFKKRVLQSLGISHACK